MGSANKPEIRESYVERPTEPDKSRPLTLAQEASIALLLQGKRDGEVAKAVGVTRQTVSEWRNHHSAFIAELNNLRMEVWDATLERLRGLLSRAVEVLTEDLEAEDARLRQSAAVHVMRAVGLYGVVLERYGAPSGPTTVEAVQRARAEAAAWRDISEETDRALLEAFKPRGDTLPPQK